MVATCATMQSKISWNSKYLDPSRAPLGYKGRLWSGDGFTKKTCNHGKLHGKHPTKCKGASPIISLVKVQVKRIAASRHQWTQPSCQPSPKRVWSPKIFFRDDLFHSTNDQPRISAEDQLLQEFQGGAHDLWITWHFERRMFRHGERWSDFKTCQWRLRFGWRVFSNWLKGQQKKIPPPNFRISSKISHNKKSSRLLFIYDILWIHDTYIIYNIIHKSQTIIVLISFTINQTGQQ